eukprot:364675-Chlamydomonas_euryale.AAC.8
MARVQTKTSVAGIRFEGPRGCRATPLSLQPTLAAHAYNPPPSRPSHKHTHTHTQAGHFVEAYLHAAITTPRGGGAADSGPSPRRARHVSVSRVLGHTIVQCSLTCDAPSGQSPSR